MANHSEADEIRQHEYFLAELVGYAEKGQAGYLSGHLGVMRDALLFDARDAMVKQRYPVANALYTLADMVHIMACQYIARSSPPEPDEEWGIDRPEEQQHGEKLIRLCCHPDLTKEPSEPYSLDEPEERPDGEP